MKFMNVETEFIPENYIVPEGIAKSLIKQVEGVEEITDGFSLLL